MTKREQLLMEANRITSADRNLAYGDPEDNLGRIAALWNVYWEWRSDDLNGYVMPFDVSIMMILMKVARLQNDPYQYDSWVDIAGYAAVGWEAAMGFTTGFTIAPVDIDNEEGEDE